MIGVAAPCDYRPVRVAQYNLCTHIYQFIYEEQAALKHLLMNEHSYSNAEMFAYALRARGLAKLVGMPTPGYVIWTDTLKLVDGTAAREPALFDT